MSILFLSHPFSKGFSHFPMDPPLLSHEFPVRFRLHALHHHPFAPHGLHDRHGEAAPATSFGATGAGCGGGLDQVKRWIDDLYKKRIWDFTWFHMISPIFSDLCLVENMGLTGKKYGDLKRKWWLAGSWNEAPLIRAYFNHQKRSWS